MAWRFEHADGIHTAETREELISRVQEAHPDIPADDIRDAAEEVPAEELQSTDRGATHADAAEAIDRDAMDEGNGERVEAGTAEEVDEGVADTVAGTTDEIDRGTAVEVDEDADTDRAADERRPDEE